MDTIPLLLTSKSAVFCVPIDLLPPEFWQPYSEIAIQVIHCYTYMTAGSCYSLITRQMLTALRGKPENACTYTINIIQSILIIHEHLC